MRPDLTRMQVVLDRINEIVRRSNPRMERPGQPSPIPIPIPNRFVELLENESERSEASGRTGRVGTGTSMDDLRRIVSRVAEEYNIDEELIRALIQIESSWRHDAVSSRGAMGLMQLMPRTAEMLGVEDAFDPEQNIRGGVRYLARLTDKYNGDIELALAAYNAGASRVTAAGGPPFPETARFVRNVMALYHRYREES